MRWFFMRFHVSWSKGLNFLVLTRKLLLVLYCLIMCHIASSRIVSYYFVLQEIPMFGDQFWHFFSPPARWGLLDFIRAVLLLRRLLLLVLLLLAVQIPVGTAGPAPRAPDPSGHCRTSTASSRSQWALPDLNRDFQVAVGTAGPQPRLPDRSGHCRTSTATSRSQWALPDLNRDFQIAVGTAGPQPRLPDRSGHCRTSTASSRS